MGAALAALTLGSFAGLLSHPFSLLDDDVYVTRNPQVQEGLSAASVAWAFTQTHGANWHPLTWLSHMLDVEMFGLRAGRHHAVSLALHTVNVVLLFLLLLRATGALWPSAFTAALFAVHPLHVESVAWVAERKDVLSALFFFLTLWVWIGYTRRPSAGRFVAAAVLFAAGLGSKPMLVTLPFVLLLFDWWPLRRLEKPAGAGAGATAGVGARAGAEAGAGAGIRRLVVEKLPLFTLSAVSCIVTMYAQKTGGAIVSLQAIPFQERIAGAFLACARYLGKALWPVRLSVYYPHDAWARPSWMIAGSALLFVALTVAALRLYRRAPFVAVGWLWFTGMLVPVIGLVQVGDQGMADRYTYLPLIGIFIAVAWGTAELVRARPSLRPAVGIAALAVVAAAAVAARAQAARWESDIALFGQAVANTSRNPTARNNLGLALFNAGRTEEAIVQYREGLALEPTDTFARRNLAYALILQGQFAEALDHYALVLEQMPDDPESLFHMGQALQKLGRPEDAIARYTQALRQKPDFGEARNNLANLLLVQGRTEEAVAQYRAGLEASPTNASLRYNLARVLARQGRQDEAAALLQEALRMKPDFAEAHNSLGLIFLRSGRSREAEAHFSEALRLKPDYPEALRNIDAARATTGAPAAAR